MPKTKEQVEAIRQQSMAAIKQAALDLFAHKGYANTSISAIAKAAGVSKGLMYNYYASKDKLLEAVIMDAASIGEELFAKVMDDSLAPKERLGLLITGTFDWVIGHLPYYKLMMALGFQEDVMETLTELTKQKRDNHIQLVGMLFQQMGYEQPRLEALQMAAVMDGIFIQLIHIKEDYPILEMKALLLKKYT